MATLTRKQILLSQENISRLHDWSDRYNLSEAELVRRAIQAYDPEHERAQVVMAEHEKEAEHMRQAIESAMKAVEAADTRVRQTLEGLNSPEQRMTVVEEVRQELAEAPGWLDEIAAMVSGKSEDLHELS